MEGGPPPRPPVRRRDSPCRAGQLLEPGAGDGEHRSATPVTSSLPRVFERGAELFASEHRDYFDAIRESHVLCIEDVTTDARTEHAARLRGRPQNHFDARHPGPGRRPSRRRPLSRARRSEEALAPGRARLRGRRGPRPGDGPVRARADARGVHRAARGVPRQRLARRPSVARHARDCESSSSGLVVPRFADDRDCLGDQP